MSVKCVEQKERLVSIMDPHSLAISAEPSSGKKNFKTEKFSLIIPGGRQRERKIQFARNGENALLTYQREDFALGVVYRNV